MKIKLKIYKLILQFIEWETKISNVSEEDTVRVVTGNNEKESHTDIFRIIKHS